MRTSPRAPGRIAAITFLAMLDVACASLSSPPAGLADGHLPACSPGPHCVSSAATDPKHAFDSWSVRQGSLGWAKVVNVVRAEPRTRIVAVDDHYLHAEVTSPWHFYTDDLELLMDPSGRIDVRSSSRVGYYDFEVNRKRLRALQRRLEDEGAIVVGRR